MNWVSHVNCYFCGFWFLSISVTYSKALPDCCLISSRRQFDTELQKDSDICNAGALMCSLQYNSHSSEDLLVNSQNTAENSTLWLAWFDISLIYLDKYNCTKILNNLSLSLSFKKLLDFQRKLFLHSSSISQWL